MSAPLHDPLAFTGRVELPTFTSTALADNPLGDPAERQVPVYVPPGASDAPLPVLFVLAGFTGRGQGYLETHPWRRGIVWHYDRAVASGEASPAILVLPDCFTKLGGSQYVNSSAVGRYADYVVEELTRFVDERYPTRKDRRGVAGKSSGGFGALHLSMHHPGVFQACASISGDCAFENTFGVEFLACLRGLATREQTPRAFLDDFFEKPDLSGDGHAILNVLAMAACYSPSEGGTGAGELPFDLPFDLATGERRGDVWRRWLAFDPLEAVEHHVDALRSLALLHVECGLADEFHLQWGARRLSRRLEELGVAHVHEEHAGSHRGIDHRYPPLLDRLANVLSS